MHKETKKLKRWFKRYRKAGNEGSLKQIARDGKAAPEGSGWLKRKRPMRKK